MINSRKRHIQNGCSSRSTAFNFPPSFYAYGIRISKGKRWKLLETSSRGRSNYKDGLKPRWSRVSMTVPWYLLKLLELVSKTRALHDSRMREEGTSSLSRQWTLAELSLTSNDGGKSAVYFHSSIIIFAGSCKYQTEFN